MLYPFAPETAPTRLRVPNDNSCLFYAVAYLCDESLDETAATTAAKAAELRGVCRDAAAADPDPETRALILGQSVEDYGRWIMVDHNWGGESEILALAAHYGRRVAVVSADALLTYGDAGPTCYLLYTGTHYDCLLGAGGARSFDGGAPPDFEAACRAVAEAARAKAAKRDASEVIYRVRCGGCGAKFVDAAGFQAHCAEVEHDDDFCYECDDIFEAVYDDDDDDGAA